MAKRPREQDQDSIVTMVKQHLPGELASITDSYVRITMDCLFRDWFSTQDDRETVRNMCKEIITASPCIRPTCTRCTTPTGLYNCLDCKHDHTGKVFLHTGPAGCGKTTLLRFIYRHVKPTHFPLHSILRTTGHSAFGTPMCGVYGVAHVDNCDLREDVLRDYTDTACLPVYQKFTDFSAQNLSLRYLQIMSNVEAALHPAMARRICCIKWKTPVYKQEPCILNYVSPDEFSAYINQN